MSRFSEICITYHDLFAQLDSILTGMQKTILAIHMDTIDAINGRDLMVPAATQRDPEMVIEDEDL